MIEALYTMTLRQFEQDPAGVTMIEISQTFAGSAVELSPAFLSFYIGILEGRMLKASRGSVPDPSRQWRCEKIGLFGPVEALDDFKEGDDE